MDRKFDKIEGGMPTNHAIVSLVPDELSEKKQLPQPDEGSTPDALPQLRDRRREKPLLSCTFCRNRK